MLSTRTSTCSERPSPVPSLRESRAVAQKEKCQFVFHGRNDQVRSNLLSMLYNLIQAPWRIPRFYKTFKGRNYLLSILSAPNEPEDIVIDFEKGMPIKLTSKSQKKPQIALVSSSRLMLWLASTASAALTSSRTASPASSPATAKLPALLFSAMRTSIWKA